MKHVLIVGPAWVGDMVMAQSLFIELKKRYPAVIIDVIAPEWSLPLLERMPQVDQAIVLDIPHNKLGFSKRKKLGIALRENQYTHAIVLPRSYKSALTPFFARIPVRTGFKGEMRYGVLNDIRKLDRSVLTQTVQRYVALGCEKQLEHAPHIQSPQLVVDVNNQSALRHELNLNLDKPVIGFMPGAEYGPAKQWPVKYYRELAEMLIGEGYQIWLFGSVKETDIGRQIADGYEHDIINLAGRTRLVDTVDLLAMVELAVTNDSGLMHIACATDRRVIAIYGSSTPKYTPPLSDKAEVLYRNKSCSPCFQRQCPFDHYECLTEIKPFDVFKQITQ